MKFQIDILVLTETFKIDNIDLYRLSDYEVYYNQGDINQNDGVVLKL